MEGRVFVFSWDRRNGGVEVWVKRRPTVRAHRDTFADADEALYQRIIAVPGDGENMREYDPPRPDAATGDGLLLRLREVTGSGRATVANVDELWTRGVCDCCGTARGTRTKAPIVLSRCDSGSDGVYAPAHAKAFVGPLLRLYSDAFLALLSATERRRFTWRAASRLGRGRKEYYEIVGSALSLRPAAFKERYVGHNLFQCPKCGGRNEPSYAFTPPTPSTYVSETDVPRRLPSCFTIGGEPGPAMVFTAKRWSELVGRRGTTGLASGDVGIVDARLIDRRPRRKLLEES